jgi:hypothetical protein
MACLKWSLPTHIHEQKLLSIVDMAVWLMTDTSDVNYRNLVCIVSKSIAVNGTNRNIKIIHEWNTLSWPLSVMKK